MHGQNHGECLAAHGPNRVPFEGEGGERVVLAECCRELLHPLILELIALNAEHTELALGACDRLGEHAHALIADRIRGKVEALERVRRAQQGCHGLRAIHARLVLTQRERAQRRRCRLAARATQRGDDGADALGAQAVVAQVERAHVSVVGEARREHLAATWPQPIVRYRDLDGVR